MKRVQSNVMQPQHNTVMRRVRIKFLTYDHGHEENEIN